ncbi:hypothetical protein JZ751_005677, partial [Albula glossodonta]
MADSKVARVRYTVYSCVLLYYLFLTGCHSDQVPLIMWSSGGVPMKPLEPPAVGHIVSSAQLVSYLNDALSTAPQNVLLFLQDKLSLDDFTVYGGVFGNKQDSSYPNLEAALQSSPSSLVLPTVSWPGISAVPALLQEQLGTSPLYLEPGTLAQLRLNASVPALLVIRLPYSSGVDLMSPKEVLSGNDEVIGQVLALVKEQAVPYSAIYTALRPSRIVGEASTPELQSVGRSLLQASADSVYPPVEFKSEGTSCILLWAENLTISYYKGKWERHDLTPQTFGESVTISLTGSSCNRTHS